MNDDALSVLRGGGQMGALMRGIDWSMTVVGPVAAWPQSLRTALSILLETGFPMYIAWGPDFTQFYNDGYRPILGSTKHPQAMGASTRQTFAEIWDIIGPMFEAVMDGTPTTVVDFLLPLDRHGFTEECYFIFSYSPIRQESGEVGGVLVTVTETTQRVLGERRLQTSQLLAARTRGARTVPEACRLAAAVLAGNTADLPFALIYRIDREAREARLEAGSVPGGGAAGVPTVVADDDASAAFPIWSVARSLERQVVEIDARIRQLAPGPPAPARAVVVPIVQQGEEEPIGVLVAALSPQLILDGPYQAFLGMIASQIGNAIASARALEEAQARAAALAELDRAKTVFFNNVSHEFRTPLTLLLGPTEEALSSPDHVLRGEDLRTVHRNGQRLLKLVNTLLDFSRIEAGRVQASFEPTDLSTVTADLASAFRSAIERAGVRLVVDCPPLPSPVYVDRDMWEKIVLNLVSNAFKFTFAGAITVALAPRGSRVELTVRDTGVGIPPGDLPRVFERFHRAERARARTHEGSGIGLALVRELVGMHGGTIDVASSVGEGTTFTASIPSGTAHLPPEQIGAARSSQPATAVAPFVEEAMRWLPASEAAEPDKGAAQPNLLPVRILVADDNADMRDYITRLLGDRWTVEAVGDGFEALAAAKRHRPDLVLSDVMMPGLDGFALLQALRTADETRGVPVVLLSARAGEEARIEGLQAGADDYLVKPFSARELIARVQAQLVRAKVRSIEETHALRLASVFQNAPVGVAILRGEDLTFEFANDAYLALVARREVHGLPVRQALPELAGQGIYELLEQVFTSGEPYIGRSIRLFLDRGGDERSEAFFDFVYQPLREDGRVTGIAVVCFEVTELATARRQAEAASRAKDEFLAMLGHELRNPLSPILTALQLMRLRGVTGAERERAVIERQVRHVVRLVDDLLDVSRITSGKVQLKRERSDLADLVAKAVEMTSPAIEERGHRLTVDVPRGLTVEGDPARLAQVFANLLTNAAKYTENGGAIGVEARGRGGRIQLSVSDDGIGIAPEMLPHVFDLFMQERQGIDRSEGGLGLGLAIVRSLVLAHGGTVTASSRGAGLGATFSVELPVAAETFEQAAPEELTARATGESLRVLVVDDNRDAAELLVDSLRALGHVVAVAFDGPSGLEQASAFRPAVALLDLGLPVMDGYELARRLRAQSTAEALKLVAITGYGQASDRTQSQAAGFDAHLVKPVDLRELDALIRAPRA